MTEAKKGERQKQLEAPLTLAGDAPTTGGRTGGTLARDVGTRDHLKRAFERPAGITRVKGSDEKQK
ncbi:hypothetical protein [Polymorphum gilvum]|uniref:hypothetical protein n=1 Tax=Polymorphum gilvum TaxID=991904 RepID=UPI000303AFD6|nr:hypothetical protein [Polymorphum gilvum]